MAASIGRTPSCSRDIDLDQTADRCLRVSGSTAVPDNLKSDPDASRRPGLDIKAFSQMVPYERLYLLDSWGLNGSKLVPSKV